jgi:Na+/H+ antiporter NhaD/arsenite permease-like protein
LTHSGQLVEISFLKEVVFREIKRLFMPTLIIVLSVILVLSADVYLRKFPGKPLSKRKQNLIISIGGLAEFFYGLNMPVPMVIVFAVFLYFGLNYLRREGDSGFDDDEVDSDD